MQTQIFSAREQKNHLPPFMPERESTLLRVDDQDQWIGLGEKMEVHRQGWLHRAFSIFLWRKRGRTIEILLQKRALTKYHTPGLWSNTCCGHSVLDPKTLKPMDLMKAGAQRLFEEMTIKIPPESLTWCGHFIYRADFEGGLIEHELDHVLKAPFQGSTPIPNSDEVMETQWLSIKKVLGQLTANGDMFTPWFKPALDIFLSRP